MSGGSCRMSTSHERILQALRQLTVVPAKSRDCQGIEEQLLANVTQASLLLSRYGLDGEVHAMKKRYMLDNEMWPLDNKGKFVRECLALLITLCSLLPTTDEHPESRDPSKSTLIGVKDEQSIKGVLQFVSLFGVYPHMSPGVGVSLKARTKAEFRSIKSSLPLNVRNFILSCCVKVLLECSSNATMSPFIYSSIVRSDIIASLIQIIHCGHGELASASRLDPAASSPSNMAFYGEQLHVFLSRINPVIVIKDLLILQGPRIIGQSNVLKDYNSACGALLSRMLMESNGLTSVVEAVFDNLEGACSKPESEIWLKCRAVSKVVSTCPSQATCTSPSQYYELICPQVLSLLKSDDQLYVMVACSILSLMLSSQYEDGYHYLISPLFQPLFSLSNQGMSLILSFEELSSFLLLLDKILTISEPASSLFCVVAEFFPILFKLWMFFDNQKDLQFKKPPVKEILIKCLKSNDSTIQLKLFHQLLRIPSEKSVQLDFKTIPDKYIVTLEDDGIVLRASSETIIDKTKSQIIEEMGNFIIDLLTDENLIKNQLIGPVFTVCIDHLVLLLTNKSRLKTSNDNDLLSLENVIHSSDSTLILFVTAAVCENIGERLLTEVDIPSLAQSLMNIIKCHTDNVKNKEKIEVLPKQDCTVLIGGHVTLSIAFGLLSAILSTENKIPRSIKYSLSSVLPDLEILSQQSDIAELASTAHDLQVCIATLGAVWSHSNDKNKPTSPNSQMSTPSISTHCKYATLSNLPNTASLHDDGKALPEVLKNVLLMLDDPLIPMKGHGLIELARLVETKHSSAVEHHELILTILSDHLQHSDSYIYMAAIRGLRAMAFINSSKLVSLLCHQYTNGYPADKLLLKVDECATEKVIKIGEALVNLTTSLGDMLPFYCDRLVTAFLVNAKHPEPLIRSSALSNLAEVCGQMKLLKVENEISSVLSEIIQCDSCNQTRQAAILVIKNIFVCMGHSFKDEKLPDSVLDLYRLLKQVECSDPDVTTKAHAQAALHELNEKMKLLLFPVPQMSKKITIIQ